MKTYYGIKIDSMGGTEYMDTVYEDRVVAQLECNNRKSEWINYILEQFNGEEISGDRVIVNNIVYKLNRASGKDKLKELAKSKLTKEELEAILEK